MENTKIVNIGISQIHPHPENPRKDLGDLAELSESVKKKGIMQNLTVISGYWDEKKEWHNDEYTLIIGHRRCAAAKLAGLKELPCRIVDNMSKKDQISTMLEENIQRNDLTIWEQANGFQMMLDLGDTEEQIADKTGFSKTTIRRRLNIAKLDQKELQKKEKDDSFQMTLTDLYALEKVEDVEIRNKILKEATDSRQLIWKAQNVADEASRQKKVKEITDLLKESGVQPAPKGAENDQYSGKWETLKEYALDKEAPKRLGLPKNSKDILYYLVPSYYRTVKIIKKAAKKPETVEDKARKEKDKQKKQIKAMMKELNARKHDFIEKIVSGKIESVKETTEIQNELWKVLVSTGCYLSKSSLARFFTGKSEYECTPEEKKEAYKNMDSHSVLHQMMLMLDYAMNNIGDMFDWQGEFNKDRGEVLTGAYNVLARYGWSFENDEEKLLKGSHDLYIKREDNA